MSLILAATVLTLFVVYAPQPLLPLLAERFAMTKAEVALIMTVVFVPLSLAPITYGYLLETVSSLRLLRLSILVLALTTLVIGLANHFGLLVGLRFIQGLFVPAALTSLMTYLSVSAAEGRLHRVMSGYVAATILGGYFGRLLSGLSATYLDWHVFFFILGGVLLLLFLALSSLKNEAPLTPTRFNPTLLWDALRIGIYLKIYGLIFCVFFVFAGLMNFLPFRLVELWGHSSELVTGLMYTGYLVGLGTSLGSGSIIRRLGGEWAAINLGLGLYLGTLALTLVPQALFLFGILFLFCGAMFLIHATAVGLLNRLAIRNKGMANGLYVSFYYAGGVFGSYLPGLVYQRFGWPFFILSLLAVASLALILSLSYRPAL